MKRNTLAAITLFISMFLAASTHAQTITPSSLVSDQAADITYSNPALANTVVQMTMTNPVNGVVEMVDILLDGAGEGIVVWHVPPSWTAVVFDAPDASVSRMIAPPQM